MESDELFDRVVDLNPCDPDAQPLIERQLIACCLHGDEGAHDAIARVTPEDFAQTDSRIVFGAICRVVESGKDVWAADVFEEVMRSGFLEQLGGTAKFHTWLQETAQLEGCGMHAQLHANSVREASLFRQLRGVASEIAAMASRPHGPAQEVLADAERLLFELSDVSARKDINIRTAKEFLTDALIRIDDRIASGGKLAGLSTNYPDLDDFLGGLRPGQLVVVGGRPAGGKTALGINLVVNIAKAGVPVLFLSLEMPETEVSERLLSMESGVPMHSLTRAARITPGEAHAVASAASASRLGGCAIYLDDTPDQSALRMASVLRRAVRRHGVQLAVVDYLQLVRPENSRDNRTLQVGTACRRIRNMAREVGIPIVLLCQLNREVENRTGNKPRLADLRESGEIEQHANVVLLLHSAPQPETAPVWLIDLIVAKNRNGPSGTVTLAYRRAVMRFENYTPEPDIR